ncbi:MAG TPA: serine/threonine-protein kinase [Opitutaceae bacterium]|nr:serine/threonine-protein kinase [Opitutaceae bacterium]
MIQDEIARTAMRPVPAIVPAPLADMVCCQDIPEVRGNIEPSVEPQLAVNEVLDGRFLVREIVGRSGMATIYRAEDLQQRGRDVALKVPLLSVESDPVCFTRFRHEEEIGLKLSHPLLLKFYPIAGAKSRPYLVMEFLRGCTLAHLGYETRPLAEADALKIVALVAEAVGYMHDRGFVHRDLKPENIMICCDRTLRVMDLGLASPPLRRRHALARLTPIFGTPEYMAPEQVEHGPIDERTDIYGLGAILYELLTGSVPFRNEDPWQSAYQRTTGDPVAPRLLNPALSPQAEEIVLHALQRKPDGRYPNMAAFQADLAAPTRVPVTGYCQRLRPPRWKLSIQGTPVLAGLLLGLGAILFFVALFLLLRFRLATR